MEVQEMVDKNTRVGKEEEVGKAEKKTGVEKKGEKPLTPRKERHKQGQGSWTRKEVKSIRRAAADGNYSPSAPPRGPSTRRIQTHCPGDPARAAPALAEGHDAPQRPVSAPDAADAWSRPASRQRRAVSGKRHQAATTSSRGEVGLKCEQNLPRLTKPAPAAGWSPLALTMATPRVSPSPLSPAHCRLRHGHPPPHTCIPGQQ